MGWFRKVLSVFGLASPELPKVKGSWRRSLTNYFERVPLGTRKKYPKLLAAAIADWKVIDADYAILRKEIRKNRLNASRQALSMMRVAEVRVYSKGVEEFGDGTDTLTALAVKFRTRHVIRLKRHADRVIAKAAAKQDGEVGFVLSETMKFKDHARRQSEILEKFVTHTPGKYKVSSDARYDQAHLDVEEEYARRHQSENAPVLAKRHRKPGEPLQRRRFGRRSA